MPYKDKEKRIAYHRDYNLRYGKQHRDESSAASRRYYKKHGTSIKLKAAQIRARPESKKYHQEKSREKRSFVSPQLFAALMNFQKGCCAVCNTPLVLGLSRQTHADHCHDTRQPRGLLCRSCNTIEGLIKKIGLTPLGFSARLQRYLDDPPASVLELV